MHNRGTNFHKITKELCPQTFLCSKERHFRENGYRIHGEEEGKLSNGMDMSTWERNREEHHEEKKWNYRIIWEDCQARIKVTENE